MNCFLKIAMFDLTMPYSGTAYFATFAHKKIAGQQRKLRLFFLGEVHHFEIREIDSLPQYISIRKVWVRVASSSSGFTQHLTKLHVENFPYSYQSPLPRYPPQRRVLELLRVRQWVAQFAVLVEAAREQVVQQPGLSLLEFGDEGVGLLDGGVYRVENFGDATLFGERSNRNPQRANIALIHGRVIRAGFKLSELC